MRGFRGRNAGAQVKRGASKGAVGIQAPAVRQACEHKHLHTVYTHTHTKTRIHTTQDALDELKLLLSEDEWDALQQVTSPATYFT